MNLKYSDYKDYRFACLNLAFLFLFLLNPYPKWILPNGSSQIIFLLTTTWSLHRLKGSEFLKPLSKYELRILFFVILYAIYFCLPFIHSFQGGWLLNSLIFMEILLFDKEIYNETYLILKKIFVWICIFSLIVWCLHLVDIEIPHYTYIPDFRYYADDNYRIYGLSVALCHGNSWLYGASLERICGVFAEPGHFGIYLGILLACNRFRFEKKGDYVLLATGILTFSTAFYGILGIGFIYRLLSAYEGVQDLKRLTLAGILLFPLLLLNTKFIDTALNRVIGNNKNVNIISLVENRTTKQSRTAFDEFTSTEKVFIGVGYMENGKVQITNWRGGVYRYGIIGILIMSFLILSIVSKIDYKFALCLLAITALVMSHRIYLMYSLGIIMCTYLSANCLSDISDEDDNEFEEL